MSRPSSLPSDVWDFLADRADDGADIDEIAAVVGCEVDTARRAIRKLRLMFIDTGINIPCKPDGHADRRWIYRLTSDSVDTKWWIDNRGTSITEQLRTLHAVTNSQVEATQPHTKAGRKARHIERGVRHLIEDIEAFG